LVLKRKKVIFRADGNTTIGLGHISRCMAIAGIIKDSFKLTFAIQQPGDQLLISLQDLCHHIWTLPITTDYAQEAAHFCQHLSESDIVVLDGYYFNSEYQLACKQKGAAVICIDDLHDVFFHADAVINHAGNATPALYLGQPYTKYFLGTDYAIVRKPFLQAAAQSRVIKGIDTVFISMGGADISNISLTILEKCCNIADLRNIVLLVGNANPHKETLQAFISNNTSKNINLQYNLSDEQVCWYMQQAQVAICPPSVSSYEACCVGMGLLVFQTASNQKEIYSFLTEQQLATGIQAVENLEQNLRKLLLNPEIAANQVSLQKKYFDGKSLLRIADIFHLLDNDYV
jgi:UDP-2,4-diacetamido-2,4,6-trideoxy-beta-L-altropyranose hydrolase